MPHSSPAVDGSGATSELTIDLGALKRNYLSLKQKLGATECGAAVKGDGYGLGAARVAPALFEAGCRTFFVATIDEGLEVRDLLSEARIAVLGGMLPGTEEIFPAHDLIPVINDLEQAARLRDLSTRIGRQLPAMLHVDTGMSRLGLTAGEMDKVAETPSLLDGVEWLYAISHLTSADDPDPSVSQAQLTRFKAALARLPGKMGGSLCNSAGIFLGPDYHFQLARPGYALYGGRVRDGEPSPMEPVVTLRGRILQVREVKAGDVVGYGGTHKMTRDGMVATVAVGYADGYLRALSAKSAAYVDGKRIPVIGRVSMDMLAVDVTDADPSKLQAGGFVELLNAAFTVNDAGDAAGTIGYEILTGLGHRYTRRYIETNSGPA